MIIDLTEYFFDFHQSLDVTLFTVSHPVTRWGFNGFARGNSGHLLVMRHLQQPYSPIFMASQLQHGDKIGKNL